MRVQGETVSCGRVLFGVFIVLLFLLNIAGACEQSLDRSRPVHPSSEILQEDVRSTNEQESGITGSTIDTLSISIDVKPKGSYYIHYDKLHLALVGKQTPDEIEALPQEAKDALAIAPEWLHKKLAETFINISDSESIAYANLILNASDPMHVDEIAFTIAHTHGSILSWMRLNGHENIIVDNVEAIYWVNSQGLAYANLVEKGNYTTLNYSDGSGWQELDRDTYYWYVVYPRAYLELPRYWNGDFWRYFLLTNTTYGTSLYDYVKAATDMQAAANKAGEWIQSVMIFNFGTNYLQPIEIFEERIGSCGQYSIFTTAVGKSALIPTVTATARAEDHEWNEFWDGRWIHWDNSLGDIGGNPPGPYIDWPSLYDKSSWIATDYGGISVVFQFRGDESIRQSRLYTEDATFNMTVEDSDGDPIDGAEVLLYPAKVGGSYRGICVWGYTNSRGLVSFYVGDNQDYYIKVHHDTFGWWPFPAMPTKVVGGSQPDEMYNATVSYPSSAGQVPTLNAVNLPSGSLGDMKLYVNFTVASEFQWCENELTKPYGLDIRYPVESPGDNVDFFIVNSSEFEKYETGASFDSYELREKATSGSLAFQTYGNDEWYIVLSNEYSYETAKTVEITVELYFEDFLLQLQEGWNLISVPFEPSNTTITAVLSSIDGKYDMIRYYSAVGRYWKNFDVYKPYDCDLLEMDSKMGIWIHMTKPAEQRVERSTISATAIVLYKGWNLVGYPSLEESYTIADLKADTGAVRVEGFDPSAAPYYLRVLEDWQALQAGHGYWIKVDASAVWIVGGD